VRMRFPIIHFAALTMVRWPGATRVCAARFITRPESVSGRRSRN
jgi:hypothetical protein